jgi:hypothetical protein
VRDGQRGRGRRDSGVGDNQERWVLYGKREKDALMVGGGLSPQFQKLSNGKYHSLMTGLHLQSYKRTMGVLANRGGARARRGCGMGNCRSEGCKCRAEQEVGVGVGAGG